MMRDTKETEKRIFVSIPLERHFMSVFAKYRDTHGRIPYLRWTPEKKLHITLMFIGSIPTEHVADVSRVLAEVVQTHAPFSLQLKKVSYAPPDRQADMVWAYFEQSDALDTLAHDVHRGLCEVGVIPGDSFKNGRDTILPHVTLARFNDVHIRRLMDLRRTELEGHHLLVEDIHLMESTSTPHGAVYTLLSSYALNTTTL